MQHSSGRGPIISEHMAGLAPTLDRPADEGGRYICPEHLQLLEKIEHLSRYSHYSQVVFGPTGSGKTLLLEQLLPAEDVDIALCRIHASTEMTQPQLLASMLNQLLADPVVQVRADLSSSVADNAAAQAQQLQLIVDYLQSVSRQLLVVVDDAERLRDDALDWLLNSLAGSDSPEQPHLVLFATALLVERLNAGPQFREAVAARCHFIQLPPFDLDTIKAYVSHNYPDYAPLLNEDHWQYIARQSFGLPGRIADAVARVEQLESSGRWNQDVTGTPAAAKGRRRRVGVFGVLCLVLFAGALTVVLTDGSVDEAVERVTLQLPSPLAAPPAFEPPTIEPPEPAPASPVDEAQSPGRLVSAQAPAEDASLSDDITVLDTDALETAIVSEAVAAERTGSNALTESTERAEAAAADEAALPDDDQVIVEVPPTPASAETAAAAPNKLVLKLPPPNTATSAAALSAENPLPAAPETAPQQQKSSLTTISSPFLREQELLSWAPSGYTLQLLGARKERSVVEFIRNRSDKDKLYYFATLYKDKPWYVVVYGNYPDRDAALAAIARLPVDLKKRKPWARSVQGVQDDIRRQQ